jgi:hypothetical protein
MIVVSSLAFRCAQTPPPRPSPVEGKGEDHGFPRIPSPLAGEGRVGGVSGTRNPCYARLPVNFSSSAHASGP